MRAEERFGPERVIAASTLPDAIETATALVEEAGNEAKDSRAAASSSPGRSSPRVQRAPCSDGTRNERSTRYDPRRPDPWKSFRGVMAGTLILEAIVVLLALPVVSTVDGGLTCGHGRLPDRPGRHAGSAGRPAGPTVGDLGESRHPVGVDRRMGRIRGHRLHRRGLRGGLAADSLSARPKSSAVRSSGLLPGQQPPTEPTGTVGSSP